MSLLDLWLPLTTSPEPGTLGLYLAEQPGRLVIPASRKNARGLPNSWCPSALFNGSTSGPTPGRSPGQMRTDVPAHRSEAAAGSAELSDSACRLLSMDWKIELVAIPVTDVDRAKEFYVDRVGFHADYDYQVTDTLRFVQLTPPGSACSIVMGTGITQMAPGSQKGVQVVVADVEAARRDLIAHGVQASEVDVQPWGSFVTFSDPDGNTWALQQLPPRP